MFTEIKTKEQLINELKNRMYEEINIHYICPECDDEQVTGGFIVYEDTIEQLEKYDCIFVDLYCTHEVCGVGLKFLHTDYITGIEEW